MKITKLLVLIVLFCLALTQAQAEAIKATIDPSELAAGSRPLGLGRAYVGLADDVYSLFQNPSGLTNLKNWQMASMYSNLIQSVDYNMLGIAKPLSREAIGLGYIKAAISGSVITKRDPITNRIVPSGDGAIGYNSSVWFLSYAVEPGKYFSHPVFKNVSIGGNLKIFNQSLTGIPSGDVYAMGTDLDLGVQYRPNSWLKLGAAGYNILPYSMGGRLIWGSGITESIPASAKLGAAVKLMGPGGLREIKFSLQELLLSCDYEFTLVRSRPGLLHLGMEWDPSEAFSLRCGLDQDAVATDAGTVGIDNNLAAGIGINISGFKFDYAFHTFGSLSANNTHFISISYGPVIKEPAPVVTAPKDKMKLVSPKDKDIIYNPYALLEGKLLEDLKAKDIKINGLSVNLYPDLSFFSVVNLPTYGQNKIEAILYGPTGRIVETRSLTVIKLPSFTDVGEENPLRQTVGSMAALGYVTGFKDGTFKPLGKITRAEMCTLLMRIKPLEGAIPPVKAVFKDVPAKHWAAIYIKQAVDKKYVKGYPNGKFAPGKGITRAEAINLISKYAGLDETDYFKDAPFPDLPVSHWAARAINAAKKAMMLEYLKDKGFGPNKMITRIEVVDILSKVGFINKSINSLLGR